MNTRRTMSHKLDEVISNAGVPSQDIQVPHLEKVANDKQTPVNPPPLTYGDIMSSSLIMAQSITTQE